MNYRLDLIRKITNSDQWPDYERANFLSELDGIAEDALLYNSIYGYLSAVLIYHQLCEEVIKLVIRNAEFFVQVSIFPVQINFPKNDKMVFGLVLKELEKIVDFEGKEKVLEKAKELNSIRIEIVHKLTKQTSLEELEGQAGRVKDLFYEIFDLCRDANIFFYRRFEEFKRNIDWDEYMGEAQND